MPHSRPRHIVSLINKKLTFAPVLAIQGARQTGKSFLAKELLLPQHKKLVYTTLDRKADRDYANQNPETFIKQHADAHPLVIDEAQKAPDIFDAVKYEVDQKRVPGKYLLLGSTEFSKLSLIRESLTGRMSRVRLFPMVLAETLFEKQNPSHSPVLINTKPRFSREQLLVYLNRGGMPGIFATRSEAERKSLLNDWIDLVVNRDVMTFKTVKADSILCRNILEQIARLEEPDVAHIAATLKVDPRRVKTHINLLTELFVIHALPAHPLGTGKIRYFLCDVGLASLLGADFERQLYTWALLEQLAQRAYRDDYQYSLSYYRSAKGRSIHLVISDTQSNTYALKIYPQEKISSKDLELLRSFANKAPKAQLFAIGANRQKHTADKIEIYEWESIA